MSPDRNRKLFLGPTRWLVSFSCLVLLLSIGIGIPTAAEAQKHLFDAQKKFSRADRLRGSITPQRQWWDLKHYDLAVEVFPESKSLKGSNLISFTAVKAGQRMQIDLQKPLEITSVKHGDSELKFERGSEEEPNVYWISFDEEIAVGTEASIRISYQGKPLVAKKPPWGGGVTWQKDDKGTPFIATACQGIGASVWWPCKDHGYDEPDNGMAIRVTVPETLVAVSNAD